MLNSTLRGSGVDIYNVSVQGNVTQQAGIFTDSTAISGLTGGVILCTGNYSAILSANISDSINTSGPNGLATLSDGDIDLLAGGAANMDQIIVEFNVKANGNLLSIEYVFASDEYPENVCSSEADVFGITISGVGVTGPYSGNAALMTVTQNNLPLGLNSVNNGTAGMFANGACQGGSFANTSEYNENTSGAMEDYGWEIIR